jgi:hypothetical protein
VIIEKRFKSLDFADAIVAEKSGWQRVDAYTVRRKVSKISDCF